MADDLPFNPVLGSLPGLMRVRPEAEGPLAKWVEASIAYALHASASGAPDDPLLQDRKSTRLNSSHLGISYAVFCLKKKTNTTRRRPLFPLILPPPPTRTPFPYTTLFRSSWPTTCPSTPCWGRCRG